MTLADRLPAYTWDRIAPLGEKAGLHPDGAVDLSVGTPVDPVPAVIRTALAEASDAPGYPLTRGTERLRSAAAGWLERAHEVRVSPDDVLPVIGTKEFIAWLPVILGLGPGDVLVHPALAYPTYDIGARLTGASAIASDSLLAAGPSRVRLVWLNSPSNPTGRVLPAEHLRKVVAWAAERGAVVASDECYLGLGWEVSPVSVLHPSVCGGSHAGLLAVHSLSKRSNLAGYRAGFVTGDPALVAQLLAIRKQAGMMVPAPVQGAMTAALCDDAHAVAQRERYAARRSLLRGAFTGAGWTIDHSEAGLYLWAAHPDHDCWSAAELLAAQCGILVTPGELYGPSGTRHIRVALTATDERVAAGVRRLAALAALCPPNRGHNGRRVRGRQQQHHSARSPGPLGRDDVVQRDRAGAAQRPHQHHPGRDLRGRRERRVGGGHVPQLGHRAVQQLHHPLQRHGLGRGADAGSPFAPRRRPAACWPGRRRGRRGRGLR
jgi:succinyldiaminopimelate transaminase